VIISLFAGTAVWFWRAADTSDRLNRARFLVAEGQRVYDERPLLGLQLMREGLLAVPAGDTHTRESIETTIQVFATQGRLLSLGNSSNDVAGLIASPDRAIFVLARHSKAGELRRSADGELLATLSGPLAGDSDRRSAITFSRDEQASVFVVRYADKQTPPELRRSADGKLLATLSGPLAVDDSGRPAITFSPDEQASVFVVHYKDGHRELLDWQGPADSIDLEIGVQNQIFVPGSQRIVISYTDGRAYLLDVARLHPQGDGTTKFTNQNFLDFICQETLGSGLWSQEDQADLLKALEGTPSHPCGQ
jgi:hypothetical protein